MGTNACLRARTLVVPGAWRTWHGTGPFARGAWLILPCTGPWRSGPNNRTSGGNQSHLGCVEKKSRETDLQAETEHSISLHVSARGGVDTQPLGGGFGRTSVRGCEGSPRYTRTGRTTTCRGLYISLLQVNRPQAPQAQVQERKEASVVLNGHGTVPKSIAVFCA